MAPETCLAGRGLGAGPTETHRAGCEAEALGDRPQAGDIKNEPFPFKELIFESRFEASNGILLRRLPSISCRFHLCPPSFSSFLDVPLPQARRSGYRLAESGHFDAPGC